MADTTKQEVVGPDASAVAPPTILLETSSDDKVDAFLVEIIHRILEDHEGEDLVDDFLKLLSEAPVLIRTNAK